MTRALTNFVLFYIGAPQQEKRAIESTEKKGIVRLVLTNWWRPASQRKSSKYQIDGFITLNMHSPSFEGAMCRIHNIFRCCVNFP